MRYLEKYLNDMLGIEVVVSSLEKQLLQQLPLYITAAYIVHETTIYSTCCVMLFMLNEFSI